MILACDIGLKRIGVAIYLQQIILPLQPIIRKNRNQAAQELDALITKRAISTLVIGLPQSPQSQETKKRIIFFSNLLTSQVPKIFVDEDFSSFDAMENLKHLKKENKEHALKDGRLDSLAACEILRRYLNNCNASLITS